MASLKFPLRTKAWPCGPSRGGFEQARFHRIVGRCDARNAASARLMERLGMRREAHLRENELVKGEWTDELVYAMLAGEWAERKAT